MTYTKFKVDADAKENACNERNVFFDANAEPERRGRIRSRRERIRRRRRLLPRLLSSLFKCILVISAAVMLAGMVFISLEIIRFEEEGVTVGSFFSHFADDGIEESPASETFVPYYLSLPAETEEEASEPKPVIRSETPSEASVPVDSFESEVYDTSGERGFPLLGIDLSSGSEFRINNETSYAIDIDKLLETPSPIEPIVPFESPDAPTVLIIHTHGTESFTTADADIYPQSEASPRSTDRTKNVVGLGRELSEALNAYGIATVHSDIMHDEISYLTSYKTAAESISEYVDKYPSIRYVIDLHRDSMIRETNEKLKPVTYLCGEKTAQLMFVVGTDDGGAKHDNWRDNLAVAATLQQKISDNYPTLMRPINLRDSRFNGHFTPGSLILEVGSCGNTYEEASRAVKLFASCFARAVCK